LWPAAEARIPKNLPAEELAIARREARMVQEAVRELAEEVRDYLRWRKRKRLPATTVARAARGARAGRELARMDLLMRLRVVREDFDYGWLSGRPKGVGPISTRTTGAQPDDRQHRRVRCRPAGARRYDRGAA